MTSGVVGQGAGGQQRGGDHGDRALGLDRLGDELRGDALVDVDRLGAVQPLGRGGRDPALLGDQRGRAVLDGALEAGALDRVGAAVHPLQHAPLDELAQVAADGLLGDGEVRGEGADLDPAVGAGPDQDLALTLVRLHRAPSRSDPCDVGHGSQSA